MQHFLQPFKFAGWQNPKHSKLNIEYPPNYFISDPENIGRSFRYYFFWSEQDATLSRYVLLPGFICCSKTMNAISNSVIRVRHQQLSEDNNVLNVTCTPKFESVYFVG